MYLISTQVMHTFPIIFGSKYKTNKAAVKLVISPQTVSTFGEIHSGTYVNIHSQQTYVTHKIVIILTKVSSLENKDQVKTHLLICTHTFLVAALAVVWTCSLPLLYRTVALYIKNFYDFTKYITQIYMQLLSHTHTHTHWHTLMLFINILPQKQFHWGITFTSTLG